MRRDAGEEGGREFSSKMPRTMSNLPDFPRRPFLYVHLLYSKSMGIPQDYKDLCKRRVGPWRILAQNFLSSNRSIWVSKNAEFYAYSKSEDEIEKKCTDKKLFQKLIKK